MHIHASREEVKTLPASVRNFLNSAWTPPDKDGQRIARTYFEDIDKIGGQLATFVTRELQNPNSSEVWFNFSRADGPRFRQAVFWKNRAAKIAYELAIAWSEGATLAECVVCGNLMQPGKGRVARTCSPKCRLELHRGGAV